jgi:hypothetical protein
LLFLPWKNVAKKNDLPLYYFEKLPKENNRPLSEKSPNLVTLVNARPASRSRSHYALQKPVEKPG